MNVRYEVVEQLVLWIAELLEQRDATRKTIESLEGLLRDVPYDRNGPKQEWCDKVFAYFHPGATR